MKNKSYFQNKISATVVFGLALVLLTLACDLGDVVQISFGNATPTRTRTPRPTFTPRVETTSTPEETVTPAVTDTPDITTTPTRRATTPPVAIVRTATKPLAPPAPPPLPVQLVVSYPCGQGSEVYEIVGSIRKPASILLGGYVLALLTPDGRLLKSNVSLPDEQQTDPFDISCQRSGVIPLNLKIDATEFRGKGSFVLRIVKSSGDMTPLSPSINVDFTQPVRWFVFYDVP